MKKIRKFTDEFLKPDAKRQAGKVKLKKLEAFSKKKRKNKNYLQYLDEEEE